ncbi:MAG: hypothetical protein F6K24_09530 [Okeania sp. SIO2D1]|nr:hypothetical protein [Okeania sp. SIO2C9]NES65473.1 hypothetical protein [Okeania sp. SIO2D1]
MIIKRIVTEKWYEQQPERLLYLAISEGIFSDFFSEELPQSVVKFNQLQLLIFSPKTEEIVEWIT